jgi:microbial collagenase
LLSLSSGGSWGVAVSSYSWDFGDGTFADTGPSSLAGKTYARPGTYTVSLRVTGSNGLSSITLRQIVVAPQAF